MRARPRVAGPLLAAALAAALAGCGEKIAIPVPTGLFSVNQYTQQARYDDAAARQLAVVNGLLFVLGSDGTLVKRLQDYTERARVDGLADPTALCANDDSDLIFVWESGSGHLSTFTSGDLDPGHSTHLPAVRSATHLAACRTGVESVAPGAETFVYIADPDSGVVHRYAYYEDGTLAPMGILCRDGGLSVRSVHVPAGMMRDIEGRLWVCDADLERNWVIRFDPTPDLTDVAAQPGEQDPWRGLAHLVYSSDCVPPVEADYVLGDARECDETDWEGGPSDELGAFHLPLGATTDGSGRYFVADSANHRLQIFDPFGDVELVFGDSLLTPSPASLGIVDATHSDGVNFAAYIFVVPSTGGEVVMLISDEERTDSNIGPPPDE